MKNVIKKLSAALVLTTAGIGGVGCAEAPAAAESPDLADEALDVAYYNNGWTMYPYLFGSADSTGGYVIASASVWSPSPYQSRKAGVCALRQYRNGSAQPVACNTAADCGSAPATLPTGGQRYCAAPEGSSTKYCHFRGAASTYCAGSPVTGAAVTTDSYKMAYVQAVVTEGVAVGGAWITYGCFEGCLASDPYATTTTTVVASGCFAGDEYVAPYCW